jgi:nucleotide-binding universal stress UspA family protein
MSYRDILAPVIAIEEDEATLIAASEMASKFDAHAAVLIAALRLGSAHHGEAAPLSEVLRDLTLGARSHAALLREGIVAWLKRSELAFEIRDMSIEEAVDEDGVAAHARVADLIVMAQAGAKDHGRRAMIEDVLFKSGRPALLVPERPLQKRSWERFMIGWKPGPSAVRAVTAALPLLKQAKHVAVATVDARPSPAGHGETPGRDLAAHLARHGVQVEVRNLDGLGRSDAKALLDEAVAINADAIVMGGYGRSRVAEFVLGGATRELLASSPLPLFIAH